MLSRDGSSSVFLYLVFSQRHMLKCIGIGMTSSGHHQALNQELLGDKLGSPGHSEILWLTPPNTRPVCDLPLVGCPEQAAICLYPFSSDELWHMDLSLASLASLVGMLGMPGTSLVRQVTVMSAAVGRWVSSMPSFLDKEANEWEVNRQPSSSILCCPTDRI